MNEVINPLLVKPSLSRLHLGSRPRSTQAEDRIEEGSWDRANVKPGEPLTCVHFRNRGFILIFN